MKLKINPELQAYLDSPDAWADSCLEREILADGEPRDSIVVWDETDEIIDGHRRYAICERHGLRFSVVRKSFPDIQAVKQWMEVNQLERRNLDRSTSREIYERVIALASALPASATPGEAREARRSAVQKVAGETGTTASTVYRNVACEEVLARVSGSVREWLERQSIELVARLKKLSAEQTVELVNSVLVGDHDTLADAIKARFGKSKKPKPEALVETPPDETPKESEIGEVPDDEPVEDRNPQDESTSNPPSEVDSDKDDDEDDDTDFRPTSSATKPSPKPELQIIQSAQRQLGYLIKALDEFSFDRPYHNRLVSKAREIGDLLERRKSDHH